MRRGIFLISKRGKTEREKEESIWKRKIFGQWRRGKREKEKEEARKNGEGKKRKYLKKENISFWRRKRTGKENEEKLWRRNKFCQGRRGKIFEE